MRQIAVLMLAAGLVFAMPVMASEAPSAELEKACQQMACQRDLHVVLRREDGTVYDETFNLFPPTVQTIGISVFAGQTVYIEAEVDGDRLTKLLAVEKVLTPEKTITAKLEQVDGTGMILVVTNPFSKALKFNMGMMPLRGQKLLKTTSCPIRPGLTNYEHWPFPIFQILLANARLLAPGADSNCVN